MTLHKNEIIWVQYVNNGEITHAITSDRSCETYYLYEVKAGKWIKTKKKASDPTELEKYIYKKE